MKWNSALKNLEVFQSCVVLCAVTVTDFSRFCLVGLGGRELFDIVEVCVCVCVCGGAGEEREHETATGGIRFRVAINAGK